MADANQIVRDIQLAFKAEGFRPAAKNVLEVMNSVRSLEKEYKKLNKTQEEIDKAIQDLIKSETAYIKVQEKMTARTEAYGKVAKSVTNTVDKLANKFLGLFKVVGLSFSLDKGLDLLKGYNKEMINASTAGQKWGLSFGALRGEFKKLEKDLTLNRIEVASLYGAYESSFFDPTIAGFENMLKAIKNITGPDAEAMKSAMDQFSQLKNKIPNIQKLFADFGGAGGRSLLEQVTVLASIDSSLIPIQRKLEQMQGAWNDQSEEAKKMMKQQETMKQFDITMTELGITLADAVLPVLKSMSKWVEDNQPLIQDLFKKAAVAAQFFAKHLDDVLAVVIAIKAAIIGAAAGFAIGGPLGALLGGSIGLIAAGTAGAIAGPALDYAAQGLPSGEDDEQKKEPERVLTDQEQRKERAIKESKILGGQNERLVKGFQAILIPLAEEKVLFEQQKQELEAQSELFDTLLTKQKTTGKVAKEDIGKAYDQWTGSLEASVKRAQEIIALERSRLSLMKPTLENEATRRALSADIYKWEKQITEATARRVELGIKMVNDTYEPQLNILAAQTKQYSTMVSLADNFALGIKAGADLRMQEFSALQREVNLMKQRLDFARQEAMKAGDQAKWKTEVLNLETSILEKQTQQAQSARALRDGWIQAISSMNTGAGKFSKIIFTQNKGTAQALKIAKGAMALSSVSGALGAGQGRGRGARWGASGITGPSNVAYMTETDRTIAEAGGGMGGGRGLQMMLRGNMAQAGAYLGGAAKQAASGGMTGLATTSHPLTQGLAIAQGGTTVNMGTARVEVHFTNAEKLGQIIGERTAEIFGSKVMESFSKGMK